jgi:hypothetical protein
MSEDFAGKNGHHWFTGIIMQRDDPAKLARVRVRIIGWHDAGTKVEDLPWAEVLLPINASRNFSLPAEGEWIHGFFKDGINGQQPVVVGVYPGIIPTGVDITDEPAYYPPKANNSPQLPSGLKNDRVGESNVPALGRGLLTSTGIEFSNNNRSHACDTTPYIRRSMGYARGISKQIATAIRSAIKAFLKSIGSATPSGAGVAGIIKSLAQQIKRITKIINDINSSLDAFITQVAYIKSIINYILNLPANLLALFKKCLAEAYAELNAGFMQIASDFDFTTIPDVDGIVKEAREALNDVQDLAKATGELVSKPGAVIGALGNTDTITDAQAQELTGKLFPGAEAFKQSNFERP